MALLLDLPANGDRGVKTLGHATHGIAAVCHYDGDMPTTMTTRPPTVAHTVRVPETLWNAALDRAATNDETVSAVIRRALRTYTAPTDDNA